MNKAPGGFDIQPQRPAAVSGLTLKSSGNPQAVKLMRRAKKLFDARDYPEALKLYHEAWRLDPMNPAAIRYLAHTLGQMGERAKAIKLFEILLALNPEDKELAGLLGQLALDLGMWEQAATLNRISIGLNPHSFVGYNNLATALRKLEQFDECIDFLKDVLPLFLECAPLWNTLATVVKLRDGIDAALPFYEEALRLEPKNWAALNNLGVAHNEIGKFEQAAGYFEKALKIDPDQPNSRLGLSTCYLAHGRLEEGWREYESRLDPRRNQAIRWDHGLPRWQGQDLEGKSILLCPEQGVGDELLFASNFAEVLSEARQVYIGADIRLVPLYQRSFPKAVVGSFREASRNGFHVRLMPWLANYRDDIDFYIEAGSLNRHLRKKIDDFPQPGGGYLQPDSHRLAFWRDRLHELGDGLKIGFCWRSGMRSAERNMHYPDQDHWRDLLTLPGCHFVNLQYGDTEEERGYFAKEIGATVHAWQDIDLKMDLDDAAALTLACDLVVGVGSAPTMMALGVGCEALWVMPYLPWWNYGLYTGTPLHQGSQLALPDQLGAWPTAIAKACAFVKAHQGA